jgi:hypothetical protein
MVAARVCFRLGGGVVRRGHWTDGGIGQTGAVVAAFQFL